ncbi:MAG: hypothetical protein O7G85_02565 [Planctomycetota bacterium]|nr:hypothetical protein [Planctomycetota bacterium]
MNKVLLKKQFERLGTRINFASLLDTIRPGTDRVQLDVVQDGEECCFEIRTNPSRLVHLMALDVRPAEKRLLLMVMLPACHVNAFDERRLFLCGHDAVGWCVSEIPVLSPALSVASAQRVMQPLALCPA